MGIHIGLDIGAISLKLAALGAPDDRDALAVLCAEKPAFSIKQWRTSGGEERPLVLSEYLRIAGSPIQTTYDLLHDFYETVPEERIYGIRVTGSGSRTIAKILGIFFENEFKALSRMIGVFYPEVRTVFEIGGESSKYIRLEPDPESGICGIADYDRSGECAAGTGSFLDQQALRMGYSVEEVGAVTDKATTAARIAGRYSVFAKSDMIHAQQKGYSPAEILRGLCDAVARNFKSSIVKGRPVTKPVALLGAVSQNTGVTRALREAFELEDGDLLVPDHYAWCGAIGTAMLEAEETRNRSFHDIHQLRQHESFRQEQIASTPLSMEDVVLLREQAKPYTPPPGDTPIPAYLGIDIGSVSTNLVALDEQNDVIHAIYLRTAGRPIEAVQAGLTELNGKWGHRLEIRGVGTTGSGRELIAEFVGADSVNDEITAHKTGAIHMATTLGGEMVDTIFEIGGQDSKFISIEHGVVVDFAMNEACAAGTGSFLEEQAEKLGISIKGEFAKLALASPAPSKLGERCTVFMERDVTGLLHKGDPLPELVAGLAYSIVLNYLNRVVRGRRVGDVIYFQGGTAYNDAVAAAFAKVTGKKITVPPHNGVMGAIGMALIARQWRQATHQQTRFRGYDLDKLEMKTRDFVCKACTNHCDIKQFTIEGQKSYWGDKCSDRYRKASTSGRKPVIDDLIAYRDEQLERITGVPLHPKRIELKEGAINVGLPRTMSIFDRYPFWHHYFTGIGVNVVVSRQTDSAISAKGVEMALAQPYYPVQVAHGHVHSLIELGVDYVFVPNALDAEAHEESGCISHFCPWNQTLPYVLRSAPGLEEHHEKFLAPSLHFQLGREYIKRALTGVAARLGVRRRVSDRAVDAAFAAQREFQRSLSRRGKTPWRSSTRPANQGWCCWAEATISTTGASIVTFRASCASSTART